MLLSLTLTTNTPVAGSNVVVTPATGNVVSPMPSDPVFQTPGPVYAICSPVT